MNYISAWDYAEQKVPSPDKKYLAEVRDVHEFRMSGPVVGRLHLEGIAGLDHVGVSICWSEDSKLLAAPVLDASRPGFKIVIINVLSKEQRYAPGVYGPLAIKAVSSSEVLVVDADDKEKPINIGGIKW